MKIIFDRCRIKVGRPTKKKKAKKFGFAELCACNEPASHVFDGVPVCPHHLERLSVHLIALNTMPDERVIKMVDALHREVRVRDLATGREFVPGVISVGQEQAWNPVE